MEFQQVDELMETIHLKNAMTTDLQFVGLKATRESPE